MKMNDAISIDKLKINEDISKIVVVDPGKNEVKVFVYNRDYSLLRNYSFPSKSKKQMTFLGVDGSSENQFKVEFEGKKYLVGDGILGGYNFETTKNNHHHKLCIYTAIANVVTRENEKIALIVGYPSSDFVNERQKEEYLHLLSNDKMISMNINGSPKSFKLERIAIYPEGIGFRPRMLTKGKTVHICDIGGQNVNYRNYDALGNTLNSFSLDKAGINHLEEFFRTHLRKFVKADKIAVETIDVLNSIKAKKIKEIRHGEIIGYNSSEDFVKDAVFGFLENNIFEQLNSKGVNLYQRGHYIIFTGGGSLLLNPYIEEALENNKGNMVFSETAKWDNCISYAIKDIADECKKTGNLSEAQIIATKILSQVPIKEFV